MLSAPKEKGQVKNNVIGKTSIQALKNDPAPFAHPLKRKAAVLVVLDDEDASPVAGPSNATAQSLLSLKMTKDRKVAIPAEVWRRVQQDSSITVRQFNKASPGGSREVDKTATHLPNSGVKPKGGESRMDPINSFMVKEFKDNVLLLSGQSVAVAKGVKEISAPNAAENHQRIKEEAALISDPALKKAKLMESSIFARNQKAAENHRAIKEEAAKITDPILKKAKLMESALFAKNQKVCQSSFQVGIQSLVCGLVFIHLHDSI